MTKHVIPITLLTGFLGSGKTTLLNHILQANHGMRIAVMVNDFGALNIDAQMVVGVEGEGQTVNLANGCICCTIRDDLLQETLNLINRDDPPEYIVVEASGVSDPMAVAQTFLFPEMRQRVQMDGILAMVDPEQIRSLDGEVGMLAIDQVGTADIVILNKIDLVQREELAAVRQWIREIVPDVRILETSYAQVPLELVIGVGDFAPERVATRATHDVHVHEPGEGHDHAHDHGMVFDTWSWSTDQALSHKALRKALARLPNTVFRAKGIIHVNDVPERRAILQMTGKRGVLKMGEPWGATTPFTQIVMIGASGTLDRVDLEKRFEGCLAENAKSLPEKALQSVVEWLRRD
ncbi:MAG: GTP-binding protein [Chloroflexi bacterium]|nr:GTP-binding protein [Chloroflexota bacterium]